MAPNKKKKKLTSNVARGFATTSMPSKHKNEEVEKGPAAAPGTPENQVEYEPIPDPYSATRQKDSRNAFDELDPEELEKQLEESELQLLIERYGESTKRTASRAVSRLQTERRLLRTQADQISLRHWLPTELVHLILDRLAAQEDGNDESHAAFAYSENLSDMSEDDILVKTWTLYRLLPQLCFSDSYRVSALRDLLRRKRTCTLGTAFVGKEPVWGLEFCFNWLARHTDPHESLSYEMAKAQSSNQYTETNTEDGRISISSPNDSRPATPSSPPIMVSQVKTKDVDTASSSPRVASEPESDTESNLEPDELIEKYVSLQTQRFQKFPQEVGHQNKKVKNQVSSAVTSGPFPSKLARLDSKLARIRSDPLFDRDEAERQWATIRIELAREAAGRRRLDITEKSLAPESTESSCGSEDIEEEDTILGELFSSLCNNTDSGDDSMEAPHPMGTSMEIRNFGKWNGMNPRRILEEACRARFVLLAFSLIIY